jgi:anti-sigma regulatory factor (Ser/Thr protein kinase)
VSTDSNEKRFPRSPGELEALHAWLDEFCRRHSLTDEIAHALSLAVEEIFVNFIEHNTDGVQDIAVALAVTERAITVTISDFDVRRFDITDVKPPDIDKPLSDREPGGLGVHFVKQVMDDVRYEYENGDSRVILVKYRERK